MLEAVKNFYNVLAEVPGEGWTNAFDLATFVIALLVASVWSAVSWFDNAFEELTECLLWDKWIQCYRVSVVIGLIAIVFGVWNHVMVKTVEPREGKGLPAWKTYFPLILFQFFVITLFIILLGIYSTWIIQYQLECQMRIFYKDVNYNFNFPTVYVWVGWTIFTLYGFATIFFSAYATAQNHDSNKIKEETEMERVSLQDDSKQK